MNIGDAVDALKRGQKVARSGWNGPGMYVFRLHGGVITDSHLSPNPEMVFAHSLCLMTPQGIAQPGWNASTMDLFADDWVIVP